MFADDVVTLFAALASARALTHLRLGVASDPVVVLSADACAVVGEALRATRSLRSLSLKDGVATRRGGAQKWRVVFCDGFCCVV